MRRTPILLMLSVLPASAWASGDALFDACDLEPAPRGSYNSPPPNDANLIPTDPSPNGVRTWFGTGFHDLFISTSQGVTQKYLDWSGQPEFDITHNEPTKGISTGLDSFGRRTLFAAVGGGTTGVHIFSFLDHTSGADRGILPTNGLVSGLRPCSGTESIDAGTENVIATDDGLAFSVNECLDEDSMGHSVRGSVDVISTRGMYPALMQRLRVDYAPVGLALNAGATRLYLTNETAGPASLNMVHNPSGSVGTKVGSLMVFRVDTTGGSDGHTFLVPVTAVNPGCTPSRVEVDPQNRVWVTARFSNQATVFSGTSLNNGSYDSSRLATIKTGPEPGPLKFFYGGHGVAIANTFRTNDLDVHVLYPRPSVMIFKTDDMRTDIPRTPQALPLCAIWGTPGVGTFKCADGVHVCGYNPAPHGDFPRNFAIDDVRLYVTLAGGEAVQMRSVDVMHQAIDECPRP